MVQVTLRLPEQLADALRREADARGQSVNAMATSALQALVDPDLAGSDVERARARLAAAGLLAAPIGKRVAQPDPALVAQAQRAAAASGKLFSDYISEDRGL